MKELYKRFSVAVNLENAIEIFQNKIENILSHGQLGEEIFETKDNEDDVFWELCNKLGIEYEYYGSDSGKVLHIFDDLDFSKYLFRLQALLDLLWDSNKRHTNVALMETVGGAVSTSPIDLGIRLKSYKQKGAQIHFSGSKFLDKKLVDDVLGVLEDKEKSAVKLAFDKGLKEFLEAKNNPLKLKNAVRDMQLTCDETIKVLFNDKNLGFSHLFKSDRWKEIGLNDYQKQIFWNLNEYADKYAKHKSDSKITFEDAENIIYLAGMFIRLVFSKKQYVEP